MQDFKILARLCSWAGWIYRDAAHIYILKNSDMSSDTLPPGIFAIWKVNYLHLLHARFQDSSSSLQLGRLDLWRRGPYIYSQKLRHDRRMAENGFAPPPPREFCRHILSCRELKAESFKRCLHSVLRGVSL